MLKDVAANNSHGQIQNVERRPKLLDQMRRKLRTLHYSYRTEQTYAMWVEKFLRFSRDAKGGWRHPRAMDHRDIERFLTHLAVNRRVSASTQKQALCAIVFLYKHVLEIDPGTINAVPASRPQRIPDVLSREEAQRLLQAIKHPRIT